MSPATCGLDIIDHKVVQLFALVSEALSKATCALLNGDAQLGQVVIDGDHAVDTLTAVELLIWEELQGEVQGNELRYLVGLLLITPSCRKRRPGRTRGPARGGAPRDPHEPSEQGDRPTHDRGGQRNVTGGRRCLR